MQASTTTNPAANPPAALHADTHSAPGLPKPRFASFRSTGIPAVVAIWIAVVAIGLAALTVGALVVDHEQTQSYLQVTGSP